MRYYDSQASTDTKIQEIIARNKPVRHQRAVGLIILDEQQDMTPLYYHLVQKFLRDMGALATPPKIVLLGDTYQKYLWLQGSRCPFSAIGRPIICFTTSKLEKITNHHLI